jgi:tRNA1Val (adenine37-N6)-methyltransferase
MAECEDLLRGLLRIKQPDAKDGLRVNADTILLAHFTQPKNGEKILELGCAHGAISLILAKRGFAVEGIDIQPHLIALAKENAAENDLAGLAEFYEADLREYKKHWHAQSFDRIVVNPPYGTPDSSNISPSQAIASASQGVQCTLNDVLAASHYLLKNRGRLDIVMRVSRTSELFSLLEEYKIPPKTVRLVHPKPNAEASVVLVEAARASGRGLRVLPPLFILDADGKETAQMAENYRI